MPSRKSLLRFVPYTIVIGQCGLDHASRWLSRQRGCRYVRRPFRVVTLADVLHAGSDILQSVRGSLTPLCKGGFTFLVQSGREGEDRYFQAVRNCARAPRVQSQYESAPRGFLGLETGHSRISVSAGSYPCLRAGKKCSRRTVSNLVAFCSV